MTQAEWFAKKINQRILSNQNAFIIVVGLGRSGKSWGCGEEIEILQSINHSLRFSDKNIIYWTDPLIDRVAESHKEQYWSVQNHIFTVINATQGFRQNVMFMISQVRRNVKPNVWSMANYYLKFLRPGLCIPYFNAEDPMKETPNQRAGDFYSIIDLKPPSLPMQQLLESKAVEFKNQVMLEERKKQHPELFLTPEQKAKKEFDAERKRIQLELMKLRIVKYNKQTESDNSEMLGGGGGLTPYQKAKLALREKELALKEEAISVQKQQLALKNSDKV